MVLSGQFCHHILLWECHVRDVDDTASTLWFYVGNEVIRFSAVEFCLVTGLTFGDSCESPSYITKHMDKRILRSYFRDGKVNVKMFANWFRNLGPDNNVSDDDMVKLALVLFLEMTLVGKDDRNTIMYSALQLVDDLDAFNSFPWGTFLYGKTFDSLSTCVVGRDDKYKKRLESPAKRKAEKYNVYGLSQLSRYGQSKQYPNGLCLEKFDCGVDDDDFEVDVHEDIDNVDGGAEKIYDDCKDDIQHSNVGCEMKKEVNPTSFKKDQGESKKGWKRLKEMEIRLKKMQTHQDEYWQKVRDKTTSMKNEMRIRFLRLSELICKSKNEKSMHTGVFEANPHWFQILLSEIGWLDGDTRIQGRWSLLVENKTQFKHETYKWDSEMTDYVIGKKSVEAWEHWRKVNLVQKMTWLCSKYKGDSVKF
ncbi:hypothetical protein Ddye_009195 [Dipteronia dyeriana]|uniref:DUF1985 domain-containing protein n=1 Tax=Dipteronia dyeriana TaxID=168575 RepID=A0AAE0CMN3_9ROSI|nr:hypothetical protein Ddye_009195 [Dipteronia dyeriana]